MSLLSTLNTSLLNLVDLFHGGWEVKYRTKIPLSSDEKKELWRNVSSTNYTNPSDIMTNISGLYNANQDEWTNLEYDSVIDVQEITDTQITQAPVERGSFTSINKVVKPRKIKVTLAKGGTEGAITTALSVVKGLVQKSRINMKKVRNASQFINRIDVEGVGEELGISILDSMTPIPTNKSKPLVFKIVTPFCEYENMNLTNLDYTLRKDTGYLLIMNLTFEEIREGSSTVNLTDVEKNLIQQMDSLSGTNVSKVESGIVNLNYSTNDSFNGFFNIKSSLM